jgi:hypothetical protein
MPDPRKAYAVRLSLDEDRGIREEAALEGVKPAAMHRKLVAEAIAARRAKRGKVTQ